MRIYLPLWHFPNWSLCFLSLDYFCPFLVGFQYSNPLGRSSLFRFLSFCEAINFLTTFFFFFFFVPSFFCPYQPLVFAAFCLILQFPSNSSSLLLLDIQQSDLCFSLPCSCGILFFAYYPERLFSSSVISVKMKQERTSKTNDERTTIGRI